MPLSAAEIEDNSIKLMSFNSFYLLLTSLLKHINQTDVGYCSVVVIGVLIVQFSVEMKLAVDVILNTSAKVEAYFCSVINLDYVVIVVSTHDSQSAKRINLELLCWVENIV